MSYDERKAMEWLDDWASAPWRCRGEKYARTIKEMLARPVMPVMPEEPSDEALDAMHDAWVRKTPDTARAQFTWVPMYRALWAHLTAKTTKEVEVEQWAVVNHDGAISATWASEAAAKNAADSWTAGGGEKAPYTVVRLTGKTTVPA